MSNSPRSASSCLPTASTSTTPKGRAWAKRTDAFGAVAKLGGLLNRAGSDDYECVYRERRLQPFWRLHSRSVAEYERTRSYAVPVAPEVHSVAVAGETKAVEGGKFPLAGLEHCREETDHEALFDGLTRAENPALATYLTFHAIPRTPRCSRRLRRPEPSWCHQRSRLQHWYAKSSPPRSAGSRPIASLKNA